MKLLTKTLVLFVGLIIILSIISTYSGVRLIENATLGEMEKRLASDLNLATFAIERELVHIERHLSLLSQGPGFREALRKNNREALRRLLDDCLRASDATLVEIRDARGQVIARRQRSSGTYSIGLPAAVPGRTGKGFAVIDTGVESKAVGLFVSVPLSGGSIPGWSVVGVTVLDRENAFLKRVDGIMAGRAGDPVHLSIFHGRDRLYSRLLPWDRLHQNPMTAAIANTLYDKGMVFVGRNVIEGKGYIATYSPQPEPDGKPTWAYGIAINEDLLFGIRGRLVFTFVGISLFATLCVIACAFFLAGGIESSFRQIIHSCREIERGNLVARIDAVSITITEFRMIASALNSMTQSILDREAVITRNMKAIQDINETLKDKTAIIKSERQKFLVILETMDDGLVTVDGQGLITYFNSAAERITGMDRHTVIARHFGRTFPTLVINDTQGNAVRELKIEHAGISLDLKVHVSPYRTETGEKGHVLYFRDVSREKKVEQFKADFVSSITHDIKSLLLPLTGFLSRVLQGKYGALEEPVKAKLESVAESASRITQLVENYLNVSRIEAGRLELHLAPVIISDILTGIVGLYSPRVRLTVDGPVPAIPADRDYLERVVTNLISNALKFSDENTEVTVGVQAKGSMVTVSVKDAGIGIPAEEIPFIFERYRRGSLGQHEGGSGLGLFIVKAIVKAHGGDIWVESTVGEGSTFYFALPVSGREAQSTESF
jgi:PAS domain S-box-containing protein